MQGILYDNKELRNLIIENPELPLLVFATDEANSGEWQTELASCRCRKGHVLDVKVQLLPRDDRVYTDEDDLEDDLRDSLADEEEYIKLSDKEFDDMVSTKMKELEPYWKECIIITVDSF